MRAISMIRLIRAVESGWVGPFASIVSCSLFTVGLISAIPIVKVAA